MFNTALFLCRNLMPGIGAPQQHPFLEEELNVISFHFISHIDSEKSYPNSE
jgi:hypothetical protein